MKGEAWGNGEEHIFAMESSQSATIGWSEAGKWEISRERIPTASILSQSHHLVNIQFKLKWKKIVYLFHLQSKP